MTVDFSSETTQGQEEVAQYFSNVERNELSTMNSIEKNYPSRRKEKYQHSQVQENWKKKLSSAYPLLEIS